MKFNKSYLIAGGIFAVLVITNPSRSDFRSYLHVSESYRVGRDYNFFICSVYSREDVKYLGVLGNFFNIMLAPNK